MTEKLGSESKYPEAFQYTAGTETWRHGENEVLLKSIPVS